MNRHLFLSVMLFTALCASARTWVVNPGGGDFTTIQAAFGNASVVDGDVLQLSGTFETGTAIALSKALTLRGNGPATTIIRTTGPNRAFVSYMNNKDFTISGLTIESAGSQSLEPGVGLYVYDVANVTLDNVHFKNFNTTSNGGALLINMVEHFTVRDCEFINNTAGAVGGAVYLTTLGGQGVFENCVFEGNSAPNNGWGNAVIFDNGSAPLDNVMFRNCTFYRNGTGLGGVLAYNYNNITISVHSCTFAMNSGNDIVGDIYYIPNAGTPGFLSVKGNLFWKSRGIVLPDTYPIAATHSIAVEYNVSSSPISIMEGMTGYAPYTCLGSLDTNNDLRVETSGGNAVLAGNGGKVRTIKLLGTELDNYAVAFVGERVSETDARGVTRKADWQDCGAYETTSASSLPGIKSGEQKISVYPTPAADNVYFTAPVTGKITVYNILGSVVMRVEAQHTTSLDISSLSSGLYTVVVQSERQACRLIVK